VLIGHGGDDRPHDRRRSALDSAFGVVEKHENKLIRQVSEVVTRVDGDATSIILRAPALDDALPFNEHHQSASIHNHTRGMLSSHIHPLDQKQPSAKPSLSSTAMYDVSLMTNTAERIDVKKIFTKEKGFHPHHPMVRLFDVATVLIITWYCMSVPYFVAFDRDDLGKISSSWYNATEIFVWVLVTVDAGLSMVTGYVATQGKMRGELELRTLTIFRNYVRYYLLRDLICLAPIDLIFGPRAESVQSRLFLLWKLSRVSLLPRALLRLKSAMSKVHPTVLRLVSLLWMLSSMFHILACTYWAVARIEREQGLHSRSFRLNLASLADTRLSTRRRSCSWAGLRNYDDGWIPADHEDEVNGRSAWLPKEEVWVDGSHYAQFLHALFWAISIVTVIATFVFAAA
jgi:hypothetical protein